MQKTGHCVVIVFLLFWIPESNSQQTELAKNNAVSAAAREFVELLSRSEYAKAVAMFDSTMRSVMHEARLKETWESVTGQVGALKSISGTKVQKYQVYDIVLVTCQCERKTIDMRVVFNASGKIAGMFFAEPTSDYKPPLYVNRGSFTEREVVVGSGEWSLHGTLSVPNGEGPFAAVVLVHGSGPNDRDEAIGPNKPFRDLAWGLASNGIAVLRYDKRTKEHGAKLGLVMNTFTVTEETTEDALAAVALLRHSNRIDANRTFVLGHSLGGMLIPRIGKLDTAIAGFVVLAGLTRPLEDVMLEQMTYILELKGSLSEADNKQLEEIRRQVDRVKNLKESDKKSSEPILAAPPSYWLDLRGYDPPEIATTLTHPLLVLQGERDYQVTMKDFARWKAALGRKSNVEYKSYPKLNHLFIEGEGKCTPSEYEKVGHVAAYVIEDIARWIKK